jgi:hypothetical protein
MKLSVQQKTIIDYVNSRVSLLELMKGYGLEVRPEPSGRYKMRCPLHNENTASFLIYPNNSYYCFGCANGGKSFNFIMSYEKKTLDQVVEMFSDRTDITSDKFYVDSIVRIVEKDTFSLDKHKNNMKYQLGVFLRDMLYRTPNKKSDVIQCFKEMDWFFANESNDDEKLINEFVDSMMERV